MLQFNSTAENVVFFQKPKIRIASSLLAHDLKFQSVFFQKKEVKTTQPGETGPAW